MRMATRPREAARLEKRVATAATPRRCPRSVGRAQSHRHRGAGVPQPSAKPGAGAEVRGDDVESYDGRPPRRLAFGRPPCPLEWAEPPFVRSRGGRGLLPPAALHALRGGRGPPPATPIRASGAPRRRPLLGRPPGRAPPFRPVVHRAGEAARDRRALPQRGAPVPPATKRRSDRFRPPDHRHGATRIKGIRGSMCGWNSCADRHGPPSRGSKMAAWDVAAMTAWSRYAVHMARLAADDSGPFC